jgi:hypothetical protein
VEPEGSAEADRTVEPETTVKRAAPALGVALDVVHLDGLPELLGEDELRLRFSDDVLEIIRARDRAPLVTFAWSEVRGLEVQTGGRLRRRRAARLILSTTSRRARFEAWGLDAEELEERLAPALAKVRR